MTGVWSCGVCGCATRDACARGVRAATVAPLCRRVVCFEATCRFWLPKRFAAFSKILGPKQQLFLSPTAGQVEGGALHTSARAPTRTL